MKTAGFRFLSLLGCLLVAVTTGHAAQTLFDFAADFNLERVNRSDAEVEWSATDSGRALRVKTGTTEPWPGVTLAMPENRRDLSAFAEVEMRVRNVSSKPVTVNCRVDNPGADGTGHCVSGSAVVDAGAFQTLRVPLKRTSGDTLDGKLFGMRGYPASPGGDGTIDPKNITQLVLFVNQPSEIHTFEVSDIRAAGRHTAPTASVSDADPYFPFIDTFGQYKHRDWPGKSHSLDEIRGRRDAEAAQLARDAGPAGWNRYGGWEKGPLFKATGFFRTEKYRGKWWLVDPAGRLFWSQGIDCVLMQDSTMMTDRETWFEGFPGRQPEFEIYQTKGVRALKGHYAGKSASAFSFAGANLQRKYGEDWKQTVPVIVQGRLRSWGINTIGNWSDETLRLLRRTPYTDTVSSSGAPDIEGSEGYWGKFPDVFDPGFGEALRRSMAGRTGKSAKDPWCIGYFSDNEMSWGDDTSLAIAALKSPPEQAAKRAMVADLRAKYREIGRLNAAWGTTTVSWDALLQGREAPDTGKARVDLVHFQTKSAELYFRTVRDAIKSVAPKQLYLGCRFATVNDLAAIAAGKYCDVVSYNRYEHSISEFKYPGTDKPIIIGEFHFGALDRGLFHTGLVPVSDQLERARAYQEYVGGALRNPGIVGTHWFQWQDEPATGRVYDEENYQIGFVDIADTPYPEMTDTSRKIGDSLYRVRLGDSE